MSDPYTISNFNPNSVVYFIRPVSYTPAMCWDCESGNLGVLADWSYPGVTWFFWFALFVIVVVNLIFAVGIMKRALQAFLMKNSNHVSGVRVLLSASFTRGETVCK